MKRKIISIVLMIVWIAVLFSACGGSTEYNNIAAQNNVYSSGTQSVVIESSSFNTDEPTVKFKEDILPSDIVLGEALEGKTVTKVTYNSATSVTVELSGNTRVAGGAGVYGKITVKHSGLESKGDSVCTVGVLAPELKVSAFNYSAKQSGNTAVYNIAATVVLPGGAFTEQATAENITLTGTTGELSVELTDGKLTVSVRNCSEKNPSVRIGAVATTFQKEVVLKLGVGSAVTIP